MLPPQIGAEVADTILGYLAEFKMLLNKETTTMHITNRKDPGYPPYDEYEVNIHIQVEKDAFYRIRMTFLLLSIITDDKYAVFKSSHWLSGNRPAEPFSFFEMFKRIKQ